MGEFKILNIFADTIDRRYDMKTKLLIFAISIGYAVMLALYYTS